MGRDNHDRMSTPHIERLKINRIYEIEIEVEKGTDTHSEDVNSI